MRVIQVVPSISHESSGPAYSVPFLCRALRNAGAEVSLHVLDGVPEPARDLEVHDYPRHRFPHPALGRSPEMLDGLRTACRTADIIQSNSLWMMPNIYPAQACRGTACKLVTAPRGTLAGWSLARASLRKKIIGAWGQNTALRETAMFHATSDKEYGEIRDAGFRQPVMVVPIGMDLPELVRPAADDRRRLVFFGRLHEVKSVDHLLLAWQRLAARFPSWELVIAGPDGGAEAGLRSLAKTLRLERLTFAGEVNGSAKYSLLGGAALYVLPSQTENFAVTVAEALSCGTPVVTTTGTPWRGLLREHAGWWYTPGADALTAVLEEAMSLPGDELAAMGANGRQWMERDYSWRGVGEKTLAAYRWLLGQGDRPGWVFTD